MSRSTCPIKVVHKLMDFRHHNQIFDVIIEESYNDILYLMVIQVVRGNFEPTFIGHVDWVIASLTNFWLMSFIFFLLIERCLSTFDREGIKT